MSRSPLREIPDGQKPRVLLVDDHRDVLDRLSAMLDGQFEIAGVAGDGHEGLEIARNVSPDLIVLDINMPRLDGFQTIGALTAAGVRTPVVFLSLLDDDETISEAFRRGGRGYVLKSRLSQDLPHALEQVRNGRLFAPTLTSMSRLAENGGHGMQVYRDLPLFLDGLAALFDDALRRGDATCVISDNEVRQGLRMRLRDRGFTLDGHARYMALDAAEALSGFMRNGRPDAAQLANIAAELDRYRAGVTEGGNGRLTIFGNMSAVLSAAGNADGAMELEGLWDSLTHDLPFFTVCGYDSACFTHDTGLVSNACARHWAVSQAQ